MNTATAKVPQRVLLDTNILVSAIVFGGKPGKALNLTLDGAFKVVTSVVLWAELVDVINKKFPLSQQDLALFQKQALKTFEVVHPKLAIDILHDSADNRVLEAAVEGRCDFIVTGDKELLTQHSYKKIKILTCDEFLKLLEANQA